MDDRGLQKTLDERIETLEIITTEKSTDYAALDKRITALEIVVTGQSTNHAALNDRVAALEATVTTLVSRFGLFQQKLETNQYVAQSTATLDAIGFLTEGLDNLLQALSGRFDGIDARIDGLSIQFNEIVLTLDNRNKETDTKLDSIFKLIATMNTLR